MKTILAVIATCGVMLIPYTVQAQGTLSPAQQKRVADELKRFGADLKLSPDQKTQMQSILGDETSQLDAVRGDKSLSKTAKAAKRAEITNASHGKIAMVLSPDQLSKWDAEVNKAKGKAAKKVTE